LKICNVKKELIDIKNGALYVKGLDDILIRCYDKEIMPREENLFEKLT
jgi:hypothetical protein